MKLWMRGLGLIWAVLVTLLVGGNSQGWAQAVPATTTTTLTTSPNPSFVGDTVTVTTTVTSGVGTPNGQMRIFTNGGDDFGTLPLNGAGTRVFVTSTLPAGLYDFVAQYQGTNVYAASLAGPVRQAVNLRPTTTVLTSSLNPSNLGQSVTFTATVTNNTPAGGAPTGSMRFTDGFNNPLATVALSGGVATFTTNTLALGPTDIRAFYDATSTFAASADSLRQNVNAAVFATTTTLTSSPNPSNPAQPVTLTAVVTSGGGTPVGNVEFYDDSVLIGTSAVNASGVATLTTTTLAPGRNALDALFRPTTSAFLTSSTLNSYGHVVRNETSISVVSSPNPSIVGANVTLTATVVNTTGTLTPIGFVEFFDDGISLGSTSVNGTGIHTLATSSLAAGNNNITVVFTPSTGAPFLAAALTTPYVHVVNAATNTDSALLDEMQEAATGVAASLASDAITDSVGEEIAAAISGQVQVLSASDGKVGFVYAPGMGKGSIISPTADVASGVNEAASWRIWSSLRYTDFDSSSLEGDQINALIGTTFLFGDGLVAGLVAGYEDQDYENDVGATLKGEGFNVGGYFGGALDGGLRFDAQVHASFLDYDLAAGAATGSTDGTRLIVGGGIAHSLQVGALTIDPTARFSGTWEWQDGYTDSLAVVHDSRKFNFGRASVGAKAAYRIDMADGASLSPFVTAFGDYRFSGGDVVGEGLMDGMSARVGLGFDLRASNGITASALAEFYGLGLDDNASAKSFKAQVAIPF